EWGETNAPEMRRRMLVPEDSVHNAVEGSRGWSRNICRHEKVHFCSSAFKDSVQLRMRLIRIAETTARAFDEIGDDGTVIYGRIENALSIPDAVRQLGPEMFEERDGALETAWWILVEKGAEIKGKKTIIERYPNRGIIVEVTPI
ncbi:MAG: radical SAM protein, partial [Methanoregulaceae archaeon]|nr:radical SAM protein [Methanoregulaceae archaeon]